MSHLLLATGIYGLCLMALLAVVAIHMDGRAYDAGNVVLSIVCLQILAGALLYALKKEPSTKSTAHERPDRVRQPIINTIDSFELPEDR